jgi:hypothetical protein
MELLELKAIGKTGIIPVFESPRSEGSEGGEGSEGSEGSEKQEARVLKRRSKAGPLSVECR